MPYQLVQQGSQWCVAKEDSGDIIKGSCHASKAAARAQLQAIALSELRREGRQGIPPEPKAKHSAAVATFDLTTTAAEDDEFVYRAGKLFQAGDYPDKEFAITAEELQQAAREFGGCDVDIEHMPTVLDGKLGRLEAVEADEQGTLYGVTALPRWLDSLLGDEPRKVSCEWDRATKRLSGLALVRSPRVTDAALMAAFARHDTQSGQRAMQEIHDSVARHGAVCRGKATMASAHESGALQQIHDLTAEHGAMCEDMEQQRRTMPYFSERSQQQPPRAGARSKPMTLWDRMKDHFKAAFDAVELGPESPAAIASDRPAPAQPNQQPHHPAAGAEFAALQESLKQQQAEIARFKAQARQAEAERWADGELHAGRMLPFERAPAVADFLRRAEDDEALPAKVAFADRDGKVQEGTRVQALQALFGNRSSHGLFAESLPAVPPDARVLYNRDSGEAAPTQEEIDRHLAMTDLGQQILAERRKGGA